MSRLSFLQDKLGKNGLRMSVLELSYIKVIQGIYTSILKQIWLPFELRVLKKVSWSKLHGSKSCTFSTGSVTVVSKVIYLHNAQTNVVHRDQEYNWKPPTRISRKQRFKKKGMIMLIKTVIKRCEDFRPPEFFERKLLNKKLGCRQKSLNKFPTAHNNSSLVRNLNRK